jgi:tetratricopeptide (TPR) repeat protein
MVPLLQRAAAARPVDPLPRKLLADLSLSGKNGKAGDASAASIEYLGWLDAREQYTAVYAAELARAYAASGDWDKAEEKAERATRVAPYEPGPRELAASVAIKRKDYLAAERHIRALIALEPDRAVHQKRLEALLKMKP